MLHIWSDKSQYAHLAKLDSLIFKTLGTNLWFKILLQELSIVTTNSCTKNQIRTPKGQTKSKWYFQADVSFEKRTKKFNCTTTIPQVNLFSSMFWINWPLGLNLALIYFFGLLEMNVMVCWIYKSIVVCVVLLLMPPYSVKCVNLPKRL